LVGAALVSVGVVSACVTRVAKYERAQQLAWTGTLAAFALAVQAVNVPAAPGVSAHALGASLVTLLLGPASAVLALSTVVLLQALLLADGGIAVIGINLINIAVIPVFAVTAVRSLFARVPGGLRWTAIVGTVVGNVVAGAGLAALLVVKAGAPAAWTFGTLVGVQALAGVVEGALTAGAVAKIQKRAPRLLAGAERGRHVPTPRNVWAWAAVGVGIAVLAASFASSAPDALELVLSRAHAAP
jgi:cobalt/nickel transport system permease protein